MDMTRSPSFRLRMRAKNRTFKECATCQANRLGFRDALSQRDDVRVIIIKQLSISAATATSHAPTRQATTHMTAL